ncbi:hypothetical protein IFM89_015099, partial [Coptis chinensis]
NKVRAVRGGIVVSLMRLLTDAASGMVDEEVGAHHSLLGYFYGFLYVVSVLRNQVINEETSVRHATTQEEFINGITDVGGVCGNRRRQPALLRLALDDVSYSCPLILPSSNTFALTHCPLSFHCAFSSANAAVCLIVGRMEQELDCLQEMILANRQSSARSKERKMRGEDSWSLDISVGGLFSALLGCDLELLYEDYIEMVCW